MSNISYFAMKTLVFMQLKIFFKEFIYTLIAPLISTILFISILLTLSNYYDFTELKRDFMKFIVPGIIIMVVIQESFSHVSENIIHMKLSGVFQDILISPISRIEIAISYLIYTSIIGLFVGLLNIFLIGLIIDINISNYLRLFYYLIVTSLLFGSLGSIIGLISYTWDNQQSFFSFFIIPISMLSGTFFTLYLVDGIWKKFFFANPFFYLVSNFRKSFYDQEIYDLKIDIIIMLLLFLFIYLTLYLYKIGCRIIN